MQIAAPSCPRCGSQHVVAGTKGFRLKRAAGGFLLLGGVGLLGGVLGSKEMTLGCMSCGHRWEPGAPGARPSQRSSDFGRALWVILFVVAGMVAVVGVSLAVVGPTPRSARPQAAAATPPIPVVDLSSLPTAKPVRIAPKAARPTSSAPAPASSRSLDDWMRLEVEGGAR